MRHVVRFPQVLRKNYSHEADMWSLGVILYILLSGLPPFWGDTEDQIFRMVGSTSCCLVPTAPATTALLSLSCMCLPATAKQQLQTCQHGI